jgi:hypothetical protein
MLAPSYTRRRVPAPTATDRHHPLARPHLRARQSLAPLLEDAADAGARKSGGLEFAGRGRGFTDSDPTGTVALDPTRRQMRAAVRRAAALILRAEDELQEAGAVIANGYLRLDRDEWVRVVEKRRAALADR